MLRKASGKDNMSAMYDGEQIRSLATPSPRAENPLIESVEELHPVDLDKDLNKGDCMCDQETAINKAVGQ